MTLKTGIDITSVDRIKNAMKNRTFVKRVFSDKEQEYIKNKSYASAAGIFAAKEAFFKSQNMPLSIELLKEIEILHNESGAPYILLSEKALQTFENAEFTVSISHEKNNAIAIVIAYLED